MSGKKPTYSRALPYQRIVTMEHGGKDQTIGPVGQCVACDAQNHD